MRLLILLLSALLVGTALALLMKQDPGFVVLGYRHWTVETSLGLFLAALVVDFLAFYLLIRLGFYTFGLPTRLRAWRTARRRSHARKQLSQGLIALSEGRWDIAEKRLARSAAACDVPLLNYLGAARAAQHQSQDGARDRYLRRAHDSDPAAELAVGLTQAELQLAHNQLEQALATLGKLRDIAPRHTYVLRLLMKLYRQLADWDQLKTLLPELKRRNVVSPAEERELGLAIYGHRSARDGDDPEAAIRAWDDLPKALRREETLLTAHIARLHAAQRDEDAARLIRDALKRAWSDALVGWFGVLQTRDAKAQLNQAERWLTQQPDNPVLLLALARLCRRNRLWGKARGYLEASLGGAPQAETYWELGGLLEQLEEKEQAAQAYRDGLRLAVESENQPSPVPLLPQENA